jgi:signal transduction histidine kinase
MRTPGHDFELAAGLCFTDGLLNGAVIETCRYCGTGSAVDTEFNVVSIDTGGKAPEPTSRLTTTSSSCGICGSTQIDELTALSSELSALASDQRSSEDPAAVDIAEAVQEVVERAQRRSGRIVELHSASPAQVMVRPAQFDRAISNLIDNAIKFSPAGSKVDVFIKGTRIEVHDSGPGIAPEDRQFVFDRFYRAAATRAMPGSGLGLAIVKQFADIHRATTFVGASGTGGAMVGLDLAPTATWGSGTHTVGTK